MSEQRDIISPETHLLDLVIRGNVDHVRNYLDECIAGRNAARPNWTHLKIAIEQNNKKMAKLLVTWGAKPSREELADFVAHKNNPAEALQTLKLAGINVTNIDLGIAAPAFNAQANNVREEKAPFDLAQIPTYWNEVLAALNKAGAPEAIVAGGAVRDLYNGRKISNVDIFIKGAFMSKSFMKKFVEALPRKLHAQNVKNGWSPFKKIPKRLGAMSAERYLIGDPLDRTDTWRIIDQASGMEFHIIMLGGSELGSGLRTDQKNGTTTGITALLDRFDIGLCQIAYDGKKVITTAAYRDDAKFKTLTVKSPMSTTMEHVASVVGKYPQFTPNDKLADILRTGKVPERPMPAPVLISSRAYM